LAIALALMLFGPLNRSATVAMPLLMAVFIAGSGFVVTAIGAYVAVKAYQENRSSKRLRMLILGNALIAVNLAYAGLRIWPKTGLFH